MSIKLNKFKEQEQVELAVEAIKKHGYKNMNAIVYAGDVSGIPFYGFSFDHKKSTVVNTCLPGEGGASKLVTTVIDCDTMEQTKMSLEKRIEAFGINNNGGPDDDIYTIIRFNTFGTLLKDTVKIWNVVTRKTYATCPDHLCDVVLVDPYGEEIVLKHCDTIAIFPGLVKIDMDEVNFVTLAPNKIKTRFSSFSSDYFKYLVSRYPQFDIL